MTIKPQTIFSAATGAVLLVNSSVAFACDPNAVRINIDWLRTNNSGAYSDISRGCGMLKGSVESGTALQPIVDGYKRGQAHNPTAAAAIDGCTAVQILTLCP